MNEATAPLTSKTSLRPSWAVEARSWIDNGDFCMLWTREATQDVWDIDGRPVHVEVAQYDVQWSDAGDVVLQEGTYRVTVGANELTIEQAIALRDALTEIVTKVHGFPI